jgi:tRNA threonylcarbamoyladenosine biosynthesis protein TsaB
MSFAKFSGKKGSSIFQKEAWSLLSAHGLKPKELEAVVTVAGPGFYTGLRLSEGAADVFKFFHIPHYSFYTYDIPRLVGIESGVWMTKAYRGEFFFHRWNKTSKHNDLLTTKDFPEYASKIEDVYIHSEAAIDDLIREHLPKRSSTFDLLQHHSQKIFSSLINSKQVEESFYFRAPEDEFKVNP